jgi:hypothetical protein
VAFQLFLLKINFCQILMASQIFSHWRFRGWVQRCLLLIVPLTLKQIAQLTWLNFINVW